MGAVTVTAIINSTGSRELSMKWAQPLSVLSA